MICPKCGSDWVYVRYKEGVVTEHLKCICHSVDMFGEN